MNCIFYGGIEKVLLFFRMYNKEGESWDIRLRFLEW